MRFNSPAGRSVGMQRSSTVTRWVVAGTVVLTGAFSWIAARSLPGKASARRSTPAVQAPRTSDDGFQQPVQPPSSSDGFAQSGGGVQQPSGGGFQQPSGGGFQQPVSGGS